MHLLFIKLYLNITRPDLNGKFLTCRKTFVILAFDKFGALGQYERALIKERVIAGLRAAERMYAEKLKELAARD